MAFAIERMERVTTAQIAEMRDEEMKLTLAERARWNAELIVSKGRGYLLTGEPRLLDEMHDAADVFDKTIHGLAARVTDREGAPLVAGVERAAERFRAIQRDILAMRDRANGETIVLQRVERDLVPARRDLSRSLDRLNDYLTRDLAQRYADAAHVRGALGAAMYALLAVLSLVAFVMAAYFTRILSRAFHREAEALDRARRALAARDEITGIVAHDLRTPLGSMMLMTALLADETSDPIARERARSIEQIAARMDVLIKTLLDVATIEAGRFAIATAPCRVDDLVRDAMELFASQATAKHVRFTAEVAERGLVVVADRERIAQVLANLVGNALKFTRRDGRVTLAVARDGERASFAVSDTGPGIGPEAIPHLFDRSWKHETRGLQGTGLGLFIVKSIIDAHDGTIRVDSKPGFGATFTFTLALAAPRAVPRSTEGAVSPPGAP
ncbi:MAG: HAMP domain-containing histidine kinase [Deltaproteobacteria bacterium]|nr:HAMP domain-containing histidine kinase [Deltaproteobacteria bacterium]MCW5806933.1 HAMP domain-containing histidine kinase [Deltaproteobacteria bacterium]